jgi:crossover junction endodeoxyribonuclease RuvC
MAEYEETEDGVMGVSIIAGIDPGMSGAVAAIERDTLRIVEIADTPVVSDGKKKHYDCNAMAALIRRIALTGSSLSVCLEQAQAMPGQGVSSTFSTGRGFGIWEGVLSALDVPYRTVRPSVWIYRILSGMPGEGKERAIQFAMRMFPGCELCRPNGRKASDGRADALCLAYYGAKL